MWFHPTGRMNYIRMKKNIILVAGILSAVALVSVQTYIIGQLWLQKDELFRLKYKALSQEALDNFERENRQNGFDTALYLVDYYSSLVIMRNEYQSATEEEMDNIKKLVSTEVNNLLNTHQYLSSILTEYFRQHGSENGLSTYVVINNFDLINFNETQTIVVEADYLASPTDKSKILVGRFKNEDNHHRISFDFYIDIAGKRATILKEMLASLILSGLSIIVVITIFMLAYRNLMRERRLSELKTDFINNMTHELKTPLSTITVASKTLELEKIVTDRDRVIETARLIGKQSVNLNQLINLILEISIWERTEFEPEMALVAVGPVLTDIVESFRAGHDEQANIESDISLAGISISADVTYFTTMINNLLSNAAKYSPSEPVIKLKAWSQDRTVIISISDNGIGIGKIHQKYIFDKFYRVTSGDIHKTKGLGLGLYYVNRIAVAHGGRVELESQPGKGSTFTVTLPI